MASEAELASGSDEIREPVGICALLRGRPSRHR
jgi:hypothetical protein